VASRLVSGSHFCLVARHNRLTVSAPLNCDVLKLGFWARMKRLAPQTLQYLGYLLFHVILSPWLALQGYLRAKRRAYKSVLWGRFWGGPRMPGRSLVLICGGLGELRLGNQFAREIAGEHDLPVALLVQTEVQAPPDLQGLLGCAPFNSPFSVLLFFLRVRPRYIFAPEFCDNNHLKFWAKARGIPLVIFNVNTTEREVSRLKQWSAWRYQIAGLYVTQNELQRERLLRMRVPWDQALALGSIGVFLDSPAAMGGLRAKWREIVGLSDSHGPVLLAGSTHVEDEEVLFPAWQQFRKAFPSAVLVLAVRNRLRFDEVADRLTSLGESLARRSREERILPGGVYMLDTYGELGQIYSIADLAFVGGTYDDWRGGHTAAEALIWGLPLSFGPNFQQQANVFDVLLPKGIGQVCRGSEELFDTWSRLAEQPGERQRIAKEAEELSQAGREHGRVLFRSVVSEQKNPA